MLRSRASLEKIVQTLFETFNVPLLTLLPADVAALHGVRHSSSVQPAGFSFEEPTFVVMSGFQFTTITVVWKGKSVPRSLVCLETGGGHVTGQLLGFLEAGSDPVPTGRVPVVDEVKEKCCYVAPRSISSWRAAIAAQQQSQQMQQAQHQQLAPLTIKDSDQSGAFSYTFSPNILFECTEAVFFPNDPSQPHLATSILQSHRQAESAVPMPTQLVLAGGNCSFPGLGERLVLELSRRGCHVSLANPAAWRSHLAHVGASAFSATLDDVSPEVISKDRYDEFGPVSIHDAIAPFLHVPTAEQMA